MRRRYMFIVCRKLIKLGLTLVYAGRRAWSPARSRRSWRSSGPIGTCCPASGPGERLSASGCTRRRSPFASCSNALPVPWLCHGTSARASSSNGEEEEKMVLLYPGGSLLRALNDAQKVAWRKNGAIKRSVNYYMVFSHFALHSPLVFFCLRFLCARDRNNLCRWWQWAVHKRKITNL